MHLLRYAAIEGGPRCTVRRYSALRSRSRRPLRVPASPFRRLGRRDTRLHILLHVGLSTPKPRKEKDVLGTAGAKMQIVVRSRRAGRPTDRLLRVLQRLRWGQSVVGPNARKSLHAESGLGAVEVTSLRREPTRIRAKELSLLSILFGRNRLLFRLSPARTSLPWQIPRIS